MLSCKLIGPAGITDELAYFIMMNKISHTVGHSQRMSRKDGKVEYYYTNLSEEDLAELKQFVEQRKTEFSEKEGPEKCFPILEDMETNHSEEELSLYKMLDEINPDRIESVSRVHGRTRVDYKSKEPGKTDGCTAVLHRWT